MQRITLRILIAVLFFVTVYLNVREWVAFYQSDEDQVIQCKGLPEWLCSQHMTVLERISRNKLSKASHQSLFEVKVRSELAEKHGFQTHIKHISSEKAAEDTATNPVSKVGTTLPSTTQKPKKEHCVPTNDRLHPLCEEKFQVIKKAWSTACYKRLHRIDGSNCSILTYLQEIEPFCGTGTRKKSEKLPDDDKMKRSMRTDLEGFLEVLSHKDFHWMRKRATTLWPEWTSAAQRLNKDPRIRAYRRKNILIFPGALSMLRWLLQRAGTGTYLGELVQWTDTIASIYLLGHDIKVVLENQNVKNFLKPNEDGCASKNTSGFKDYDLIFTDIHGVNDLALRQLGKSAYSRYRCKVRILDSFGTDAEFNYKGYHKEPLGGRSYWGNLNLLLPQFFTYFPHSPDNTFLGFASGSAKLEKKRNKKNQAVIYGKDAGYLKGKMWYIDVVKEFFEVHTTMAGEKNISSNITNHGVLAFKDLMNLLEESKVFIGLGFPFEGPAPLEAIASGTVYLNPKFTVPKDKINEPFFGGKPNARKITSQNQYMEDFVDEPYSYTIDITDKKELRTVLKKIKDTKEFVPFLPREFTNIGMLERVAALIEHQDLCDVDAPRWPPLHSLHTFKAKRGVSCKDECHRRGLICEWSFFHDINKEDSFTRLGIRCNKVQKTRLLESPSFNRTSGHCLLQDHYMYFSCAAHDVTLERLCPCRTFIPEQAALCQGCL